MDESLFGGLWGKEKKEKRQISGVIAFQLGSFVCHMLSIAIQGAYQALTMS